MIALLQQYIMLLTISMKSSISDFWQSFDKVFKQVIANSNSFSSAKPFFQLKNENFTVKNYECSETFIKKQN